MSDTPGLAEMLNALHTLAGHRHGMNSSEVMQAVRAGNEEALAVWKFLYPQRGKRTPISPQDVSSKSLACRLSTFTAERVRHGAQNLELTISRRFGDTRYRVITITP
jgi:hypothetical protein